MEEAGSGAPGPPSGVTSERTPSQPNIVSVWLENAAGVKSAAPLRSSIKKSSSASNVAALGLDSARHARPSSARPRVSISPTTSLTASIGAQLAKHAAYLARAKQNMLRVSDSSAAEGTSTSKRYRGITGFKTWGKGVILKAYQARGARAPLPSRVPFRELLDIFLQVTHRFIEHPNS